MLDKYGTVDLLNVISIGGTHVVNWFNLQLHCQGYHALIPDLEEEDIKAQVSSLCLFIKTLVNVAEIRRLQLLPEI
jgi:hypothetical protein